MSAQSRSSTPTGRPARRPTDRPGDGPTGRPGGGPIDTSAGTPSAASRAARPFGYLAIGLVWTVLWLIVLACAAALPVALAGQPLADRAGITALGSDVRELGAFLFAMALTAVIFGWLVVLAPFLTWPLAVLSFTYAVRSLRPAYAQERLSTTGWTREAIGPVTAFPTAVSLLPNRRSRFTDVIVLAYVVGWMPSARMVAACAPVGVAYLFTTGWVLWPVRSPALVVLCALGSVALVTASVVLMVAAVRRRLAADDAGTA